MAENNAAHPQNSDALSPYRDKCLVVFYIGTRGPKTGEWALQEACALLEDNDIGICKTTVVNPESMTEEQRVYVQKLRVRLNVEYSNPLLVFFESCDNLTPGKRWKNPSVEICYEPMLGVDPLPTG